MGNLITMLTDFGTQDGYVAAMKGIILSLNPSAVIVDITHEIPPQDVHQAAFVLGNVYRHFPPDTIHLAVVDPGVGSARLPVVLATPEATVVAPDNGLVSYVLADLPQARIPEQSPESCVMAPIKVRIPQTGSAVELNDNQYWLPAVSSTFHGRDIFAPVAAHLSLGVSPPALGKTIDSLNTFPLVRPLPVKDGLLARIVHVDRFGNLVTSVRPKDLPFEHVSLELAGNKIHGISHSYAETNGLLAIFGGFGYLEVALKNGNAAEALKVAVGDEVHIKFR